MSGLQNTNGNANRNGNGTSKDGHANDNHPASDNNDFASETTPLLSGSNNTAVEQQHSTTHQPPSALHNASDVEQGLSNSAQPSLLPVPPERLNHWSRVYSISVKTIGALLLLCLLVAALFPWIAQRVLDHAMVLEIQKTDIHDMDDTGFQISIQSTIYLDSAKDGFWGLTGIMQAVFRPTMTIKPTTLTLNVPSADVDVQMAEFEVERQQMRMGDILQLEIATHVRVTDSKLMAEFFGKTLQQSTVDLAVQGPILMRLGPLWYMKLRINRVVPMEGLRGVQDAALISLELPDNHPLGGVIMSGVARIRNPSSVVSLQMDNITFGIYLPSKTYPDVDLYKIAEVSSTELRLEAGKSNDIALMGRLFHLDDWSRTEKEGRREPDLGLGSEKQLLLGQLLSRFIQGNNSTIQVRALSKDPNMPLWLSEALKTIVLTMVFPGSPTKDFIRSLDMNQLEFGFTHDQKSAQLSGQLSSVLQLPPNVTFPIKLLKMKPTVWLKPPGGDRMASLNIHDFLPTVSRQHGTTLEVQVELEETPLQVLSERLPEFYGFLNSSFTSDWIELGITGEASAVVDTGLGTFELGPIPFDVVTTQRGLGGLVTVPPLLEKLDVVDSTEHSLTVKATLVLWNPSNISATLGDLSFMWSYGGYLIGMATVPDLTLHAGNNTVECIGMMNPSIDCARKPDPSCDPGLARNASREFISKYISGDNTTTIDVLGYAGSTRIPLLQPMMSSFSISTHLPAIEQDFLISATLYLLSHTLVLELLNPLDTVITVLYVNATTTYKDERLGHVLVDFEHDIASPKPILIPANDHQNETSGYVKTPRLPVTFDLSSVGYEALKKALGGSLEVDVVCHIKAKVGALLMWVDFVKDGVNANVRKGF